MRIRFNMFDYPNKINNPVVSFSGTDSGTLLAADSNYRWCVLALYIHFASTTKIQIYFGDTPTNNYIIYTYGETVSAIYNDWFYEGKKGEAIKVASTGGDYYGCLTYVGCLGD